MAGPAATPEPHDARLLLLSDADNVLVARRQIEAGDSFLVAGMPVRTDKPIRLGHKVARRAIEPGEKVLKYGAPIGSATMAIGPGEHVHVHNMKSDYTRTHVIEASDEEKAR